MTVVVHPAGAARAETDGMRLMDEQSGPAQAYDSPGTRPAPLSPAPRAPVPPGPVLPPRRGGLLRGLLIVLVLGGAIGALIYYHPWAKTAGRGGAAGRYGDAPQAVRTAPAVAGDMPVVLNELGTVTPLATVTVQTQISGYLQQVAFTEGQMVKPGDFLAQIDPRPYQAALETAQGTLAHDQALLVESRIDLARYQKLASQDSIAKQQVDTQAALVKQYEGSVLSDQGTVDTQKTNLIYCHITAPVAGRVGLRQVDQGNYVTPSLTNGLVVITQLQPISVIFTVPEDALPQIMPRLAAGVKLPVTATDRADSHKLAEGVMAVLDNQVDTTTGTVKIRAMFDNTDSALFPNQFVNVELLVDTIQKTVLVPTAAIQRGVPGTYVFVVKPDDTVSVQPVTIGPSDGTNTAVLKGLSVGEAVVIDGTDRLHEGAKVTVPVATPPGAEATPPARHHRHATAAQ
jgi:multidrug efflux system membrane fusion protein